MKPVKVVIKIGGSLIREAPELVDRLVKEFGSGIKDAPPGGVVPGKCLFPSL